MQLDDRYGHYAKQGQVVEGTIEEGEWLRISDKIFLPMKVGLLCILQPITKEEYDQERLARGSPVRCTDDGAGFEAHPFDTEGNPQTVTARSFPEAICKAPLQDPNALNQFCTENPINALGDTPRGSPSPSRQNLMQASNPDSFSA